MTRRPTERGFTLLEMLIALVVLGLLVTGLAHGVRTAFAMWSAQTRLIDRSGDTGGAARVVRGLLRAMQPISPTDFAAGSVRAPVASGEPDRLSFVTDMPGGLGTSRRADVTIVRHGDRIVLLWLARDTGAAGAPETAELLGGVTRLEFAYWRSSGGDGTAGWLGHWEDATLPRLVRVRVGFPPGDRRRWPDLIAAPLLWTPPASGR